MRSNPVIVALDTPDLSRLTELADAVAPFVGAFKIGLEAYVSLGPSSVEAARARGPVFADLKLHDIPNTVSGAAAAAAKAGVDMLTVHGSGGPAMVEAAALAAPDVAVLAVTVLTSMDDAMLAALGLPPVAEQVPRLAHVAVEAGAAGVVCSASDLAAVREAVGSGPLVVVPGIRPDGDSPGDQARVATPLEALAAGADRLVIGRPITAADDPAAAARAIAEELHRGA